MTSEIQHQLSALSQSYPVEVLRCALIRTWAEHHDVTLKHLARGRAVSKHLDSDDEAAVEEVCRALPLDRKLTLKDIEYAFELLIEAEHRTKQGTVYTPHYIIDYLLEHSLAERWDHQTRPPRICDPACGSAGFLLRAARLLEQKHGLSPEIAFRDCLFGIDNDPQAVENAQCLIELYLASKQVALPGPEPHLLCADTLLTPARDLRAELDVPGGFDVVVTNPPYVKLQNLAPGYRKTLSDTYAQFVRGSFGLAPLFLVAGLRLTSESGCAAMITQNNLFTSLAGRNVRRFLQEGRHLHRIIDFGHQKVFSKVSAYTCLIFLSHRSTGAFEFETLAHTEPSRRTLSNASFSTIRLDQLDARKWRLAKGRHFNNLLQIESAGIPLGDLTSIKVGFATLKDAVFFAERENGCCLARDRNGQSHEIEMEATRPAVKIAEVERPEDVRHNTRRIIFPYHRREGKYHLIPESEFKTAYPSTYAYLSKHRNVLAQRDKGRKTYGGWYAWGRSQGREAGGPKLLTKTFSSTPRFYLDESDQLFCNGYSVSLKQSSLFGSALSLAALQRILNSKLMHYYAKLTSFQIEGDYQCYQKNFIERFGIVSMTGKQADRLLHLPAGEVDEFLCHLYEIPLQDVEEVINR